MHENGVQDKTPQPGFQVDAFSATLIGLNSLADRHQFENFLSLLGLTIFLFYQSQV